MKQLPVPGWLFLILIFSAFYFSCGKDEEPSAKKVTLTFGIHQSGLPNSGIVQEIAEEYEAGTGVKIDFQIVPDAQWRDLLKAKLIAGEAPDIFAADADPFSLYDRIRPDKNCVDLTDKEFVSRMDPSVIPGLTYEDRIYGITFPGYKIWFYFYNKQIFADLGLEAPKNYAEFKHICQVIKDAGIVPVYEALQNGWHQVLPLFESGPLFAENTPGLYDKLNKNEINITDLELLELIIIQLKEFADLGYYGDDFIGNSLEGNIEAFAEEKIAMVLEGAGWGQQLIADYPEFAGKVGFFVMPWADNRILGINPGSNAYFANKNGKNVDEVLKFFCYLAEPENLQKRLDGDPSALLICWPEIEPKMPKEYADYIKSLSKGNVMQYGVKYIDTQWMDVGKDLEAMYIGAITPQDVMDNIALRRDEQAMLQNDPAWK